MDVLLTRGMTCLRITTIVAVKRDDGKRYTNYRKLGQRIEFAHQAPTPWSIDGCLRSVKATDSKSLPISFGSSNLHALLGEGEEDEDSEDGMRLKQEFYLETDRAYRALLKSERKGLGIQLR